MTRTAKDAEDGIWRMDPHDDPDGGNGYVGHMNELGDTTRPWNAFRTRDDPHMGYTSPIDSRLAPSNVRDGL